MTPRKRLLVISSMALLAILALLVAGSRHIVVRTASAHVPNQTPLPALRPGHSACEAPLVSHGPAHSVAVWGTSGPVRAHLTVTVQDATTREVLAAGALGVAPGFVERVAQLVRYVPGGRPVRVCVTDDAGEFSMAGSTAGAPDLTATGVPAGQKFSLELLDDGSQSLIGSLSTAFYRASLWRPSWVGPWTFWVLTFALLATFVLAVFAVVSAAGEDDRAACPRSPDRPGPVSPSPAEPSPEERSEPRQDRPQPVS